MSTVVNRMTLTPLYNVELTRYDIAHFFHDPDISAVRDVDPNYWKESSGVFTEMTTSEKSVVDAAVVASEVQRDRRIARDKIDVDRVLRAFAAIVKDEINILRRLHGLPDRTMAQLVTAIKTRIDTD